MSSNLPSDLPNKPKPIAENEISLELRQFIEDEPTALLKLLEALSSERVAQIILEQKLGVKNNPEELSDRKKIEDILEKAIFGELEDPIESETVLYFFISFRNNLKKIPVDKAVADHILESFNLKLLDWLQNNYKTKSKIISSKIEFEKNLGTILEQSTPDLDPISAELKKRIIELVQELESIESANYEKIITLAGFIRNTVDLNPSVIALRHRVLDFVNKLNKDASLIKSNFEAIEVLGIYYSENIQSEFGLPELDDPYDSILAEKAEK